MAPQQQHLSSFFRSNNKECVKRPRVAYCQENSSRFGQCPLCNECFPMHVLIIHAGTCGGTVTRGTVMHLDKCAAATKQGTSTGIVIAKNTTAAFASEQVERTDESKVNTNDKNNLNTGSTTPFWWKIPRQPAKIRDPILPTSEPLPGLFLFKDFITKEEETAILAHLDDDTSSNSWKHGDFNGPHFGKRWGVHCNLRDRKVGAAEYDLPSFVTHLLLPRLCHIQAMKGMIPNEANAIDYRRSLGHYLTHHVDDRKLSREPIANLSMAGDCYMVFQREKQRSFPNESLSVLLERRTLQILTGNARYEYAHGIANCDLLSDRRVSVTMRESPLTTTKKV